MSVPYYSMVHTGLFSVHTGMNFVHIWILATYDVVRHVRCRTSCTYDIVRVTYDIVLNIARTMSYVRYTGSRRTTSYVRHRTWRTMSYVNIRHRTSHIRHRTCSSQHIADNVVCQKWTYDVVCTWHTTSYVHIVYDIVCTYDVACQHTTSYVRRTTSYVCWRWSFQLF
jgi:hypothetical protein